MIVTYRQCWGFGSSSLPRRRNWRTSGGSSCKLSSLRTLFACSSWNVLSSLPLTHSWQNLTRYRVRVITHYQVSPGQRQRSSRDRFARGFANTLTCCVRGCCPSLNWCMRATPRGCDGDGGNSPYQNTSPCM